MTAAAEYYEHNRTAMTPVREAQPELLKGFAALHGPAMKEGELDLRQKELIAFAVGLAARCENCIYSHARAALKAGATVGQVREAAGVAVLMGGGPVYTYLPRVEEALEALRERGELS